MLIRPRRNRKNASIRNLISENTLTINDFIAPLFFVEGSNEKIEISSMPGQYRFSIDNLVKEVKELQALGVNCVSLFPAVDESFKTTDARESFNPEGLNQRAIKAVKDACPDILVMTDIALDPYSSDGHDGIVDPKTDEVLNDQTLDVLAKMALCQANAGSDIVGPSDMMDGRIGYIRQALEENNFKNTTIMAYTAKYASAYYGPFRDALDSAPKKGDKKTYQMDFANSDEALLEADLDAAEGADILMVKPGLAYLDVVYKLKQHSNLPIAVYNVSGEYAMVKAAGKMGWLDEEKVMMEQLTAFKRAGADMILTYFAKDAAKLIHGS
jgi:porphobilinogen synthase